MHKQWPVVGMVNKGAYDSQQRDTICDAYGPCQMIQWTLKQHFRRFQLKMLRSGDFGTDNSRQTDNPLHMHAG